MGYYQGDFYKGYRGDPGFFSFLGGLARKAVSFIPGVGPVASSAIGTATSALSRLRGSSAAKAAATAVMKHPVLSAAGAAGAIGAGTAMVTRGKGAMHPAVAAALGHRRHRRMNACNPKALRRALRRAHSFERVAMRTIHLMHPKKHVTFGGWKKRRKAK